MVVLQVVQSYHATCTCGHTTAASTCISMEEYVNFIGAFSYLRVNQKPGDPPLDETDLYSTSTSTY